MKLADLQRLIKLNAAGKALKQVKAINVQTGQIIEIDDVHFSVKDDTVFIQLR